MLLCTCSLPCNAIQWRDVWIHIHSDRPEEACNTRLSTAASQAESPGAPASAEVSKSKEGELMAAQDALGQHCTSNDVT